ncbi:hypothetical protein [Caminibacter pacificus]
MLFAGCANKNINLNPNLKIAIEGINKKHFCPKDYSTGYLGGCGGTFAEAMSINAAIDGCFNIAVIGLGEFYIIYKIADYNKKPLNSSIS